MRILSEPQLTGQQAQTKVLSYKVEVKPSEASDDSAYIDVTSDISNVYIETNVEGTPSSAVIDVTSTKGKFDIVNVLSAYRLRYKALAKVRIYAGFTTPDNLIFTGYVKLGFELEYKYKSDEIIPISLVDRGGLLSDLKITSDLYEDTSITDMLTDILVREAGMSESDIDIDPEFDVFIVDTVQFVDENIWTIIQLCAQARMQVGYVDYDGKVKTQIVQTESTDWRAGTPQVIAEVKHRFDESSILSGLTVIGGISFAGLEGTHVNLLDINPQSDYNRGIKSWFEENTGGTGHDSFYDSLYGDPLAATENKSYGIGFQGTCVPVDLDGPVVIGGPGNFYGWDYGFNDERYLRFEPPFSPARSEIKNWYGVFQGPFQWTRFGVPNEPYQDPQTGVGEEAGTDGYFEKYNSPGIADVLNIDPGTVGLDTDKRNPDGHGRLFPPIYGDMMSGGGKGYAGIGIGILPDESEWENEPFQGIFKSNDKPIYPYPAEGSGPTETEFWTYCITFFDFYNYYHGWKKQIIGSLDRFWIDLETNAFFRVIQWGQSWAADTVDLPEEHYNYTYYSPTYYPVFGSLRIDDIENPLLSSGTACEYVAEQYTLRRNLYATQGVVNLPLNLEIELGDVISVKNSITNCQERILVSRLAYNFKVDEPNFTDILGAIIDSEGQAIDILE